MTSYSQFLDRFRYVDETGRLNVNGLNKVPDNQEEFDPTNFKPVMIVTVREINKNQSEIDLLIENLEANIRNTKEIIKDWAEYEFLLTDNQKVFETKLKFKSAEMVGTQITSNSIGTNKLRDNYEHSMKKQRKTLLQFKSNLESWESELSILLKTKTEIKVIEKKSKKGRKAANLETHPDLAQIKINWKTKKALIIEYTQGTSVIGFNEEEEIEEIMVSVKSKPYIQTHRIVDTKDLDKKYFPLFFDATKNHFHKI